LVILVTTIPVTQTIITLKIKSSEKKKALILLMRASSIKSIAPQNPIIKIKLTNKGILDYNS